MLKQVKTTYDTMKDYSRPISILTDSESRMEAWFKDNINKTLYKLYNTTDSLIITMDDIKHMYDVCDNQIVKDRIMIFILSGV